ncbi:MAG TPA: hypothetical protein VL422_13555 [Miltoncostaea sp.]|nr:hypothetical protein [Miltoncostaea sp.]
MLRRRIAAAAAAVALAVAAAAPQAGASSTNCSVAASGGFIGCLSWPAPTSEAVRANAASGTPYRFQLVRPADGARWGWWQWGDTNFHYPGVAIPSGSVTAQVDDLGSGTASYYVELD